MEAQVFNWGFIQFLISVAAMLFSGTATLIALWVKRQAVAREAITKLENQVAILEVRVQSVPTSEAWGDLKETLASIRGEVHVTANEIKGVAAGLKRVESTTQLLVENELRAGASKEKGA